MIHHCIEFHTSRYNYSPVTTIKWKGKRDYMLLPCRLFNDTVPTKNVTYYWTRWKSCRTVTQKTWMKETTQKT